MSSPNYRCCQCEQCESLGTAIACPLHQDRTQPHFLCPSAAILQGQTAPCLGMGLDLSAIPDYYGCTIF